jgi:hypothetical protein
MKIVSFVSIVSSTLFLTSCSHFYMVGQKQRPEIKASPDKATLVVYRGTAYGALIKIENFVDRRFIGQTWAQSYFFADVDPGRHYVFGVSENVACAKINFEAGKVYYLLQAIYPGAMIARTGFSGSDPTNFDNDVKDMAYYTLEKGPAYPTMADSVYEKAVSDFEDEMRKNPKRHEDTSNLKGF